MSSLGGAGGLFSRITEGISTALGQLAQFFRLPGFAAVEPPGTPAPSRPQLTTPEQIVEQIAARQLVPPQQTRARYNAFYICIATDADTNETLARIPHDIEYDAGTARSTIYSRARSYAMRQLPRYLPGEDISQRNVRWTCRLVRTTQIYTP